MIGTKEILQHRGQHISIHFGNDCNYAGTLNDFNESTNVIELENRGATLMVSLDAAIAVLVPIRQGSNSFHPAYRK